MKSLMLWKARGICKGSRHSILVIADNFTQAGVLAGQVIAHIVNNDEQRINNVSAILRENPNILHEALNEDAVFSDGKQYTEKDVKLRSLTCVNSVYANSDT